LLVVEFQLLPPAAKLVLVKLTQRLLAPALTDAEQDRKDECP